MRLHRARCQRCPWKNRPQPEGPRKLRAGIHRTDRYSSFPGAAIGVSNSETLESKNYAIMSGRNGYNLAEEVDSRYARCEIWHFPTMEHSRNHVLSYEMGNPRANRRCQVTGIHGEPALFVANFLPLEQQPDQAVYEYRVEFDPPVESRTIRYQLLDQCHIQEDFGSAFVFNGTAVYVASSTELEGMYIARHPNTNEEINIRLHSLTRLSQNHPQAIICYSIVMKSCMDMIGLKRVGKSHHDDQEKIELKECHIELWPGFEIAIKQCENRLMLCIENRFRVIRTQSVWDIMSYEYERMRQNPKRFHVKMDEMLVGATVCTRYNNKMYRVTSINYEMSPASTFTLLDGSVTTLKEYFENNYNLTVTQLEQPVIICEWKTKQVDCLPCVVYLLPELCFPTGLTDAMRQNFRFMKEFSHHTVMSPEKRRRRTENLLRRIRNNDECRILLLKWGIELTERLVSFHSWELEPEKLIGIHPQGYFGKRADMGRVMHYNGCFRGMHLENWVVVFCNTAMAQDMACQFIEAVKDFGKSMRIAVNHPLLQTCNDTTTSSYHSAVVEAMERMPTLRGRQERGHNRNFISIVRKIVLQMNCKMGGAPWKMNIPVKNAIFIGCYHYCDPMLHGRTDACVSTTDQDYTKFYCQTRSHENSNEPGANLEALRQYFVNNDRTLPEKIFLYCDGVDEEQFSSIKEQGVSLVQQACREAITSSGLKPACHRMKLAIIIVTKNINVRIFKCGADYTFTNPSPGTVVNSTITRPEKNEFYLVPSHVGLGTAKPVCYTVIYDDTGLSPDDHHRLAFKLCHLYYNWQGTVRVPALCQYAFKLASMMSQSVHGEVNKELRGKLFFL
uniref:Piwi domain-containing protein n=2 Tax=Angiostrongylus cantonensis TaxID=6313 RepID=A0A0K0DAK6_ANGCA